MKKGSTAMNASCRLSRVRFRVFGTPKRLSNLSLSCLDEREGKYIKYFS